LRQRANVLEIRRVEVAEMAESNWKKNERQAAAALGLSAEPTRIGPEQVTTLDLEF
jgi:hypothetical protein